MKDRLETPPLFVRAVSPDGRDRFERVERIGTSIGNHVAPGWRMEVVAPSGASIDFEVGDDHEVINYQDLRAMFVNDTRRGLWKKLKPWAELKRPDDSDHLGICPFAGTRIVEDAQAFEKREIDRLFGVKLDSEHSSILSWTDGGPAVINVSNREAFIYHAPNYRGHERNVRTMVLPNNALAAAYWAFAQNGYPDASGSIARILLKATQGSVASLDDDSCYLLCDFILNFGTRDVDPQFVDTLFGRLEDAGTVDAAILRFCFASDEVVRVHEAGQFSLFETAVTGLSSRQCGYTEVFRAFIARLDETLAQFHDEIIRSPDLRSTIRQVKRLAACVYWDGVLLAYRASQPGVPDPRASSSDVLVAAKKKSVLE